MSLTKKDIDLIQALLEDSQFDRLSVEIDGVKVELARSGARPFDKLRVSGSGETKPTLARPGSGETKPTLARPGSGETKPTPAHAELVEARTRKSTEEGLVEVKSPLLGVFYRAPKPGEPPFVEVGARVEADTVIGIIEVMKLMNSARAGVAGEVVEILGQNGEMVEHGEVLMFVRPD